MLITIKFIYGNAGTSLGKRIYVHKNNMSTHVRDNKHLADCEKRNELGIMGTANILTKL